MTTDGSRIGGAASPPSGAVPTLLVVTGPGGVGKGTVVAALRRKRPALALSVSATTRSPRSGEEDGRDYHFLSDPEFDRLVDDGELLEWAEFAGSRYGTLWSAVAEPLESGQPIVLEIEVQGARQVRARYPSALLVFVVPPSMDTLRERLEGRGDAPDAIARRLEIAEWELAQASEFDHIVVNDRVEDAVTRIERILDSASAS